VNPGTRTRPREAQELAPPPIWLMITLAAALPAVWLLDWRWVVSGLLVGLFVQIPTKYVWRKRQGA